MRHLSCKWILSALVCIYMLFGCAGVHKPAPHTGQKSQSQGTVFETRVDALIESIQKKLKNTPYEYYPSYFTVESLIQGEKYTEFEAYLIDNLKKGVPKAYRELTRQNWFELRENSNLSIDQTINVFILHVRRNNVLNKAEVHVSLRGSGGNEIFRNLGEMAFDYSPASIARAMDLKQSTQNPFPKGLPENPYKELEKFAYGLTRELVDRYKKTGALSPQGRVSENEIRVYINLEAPEGISSDLIRKTIQDRLVESGSFRCTFHRKDFKKFVDQLTFYETHGRKEIGIFDVSEFNDIKIDPASIYLTIDISVIKQAHRASMRAFWMTNPQESNASQFISTNLAGLYLSSFFGLAYLDSASIPKKSEIITGLWKIKNNPKGDTYGFIKISKREGNKYYGDLFVPDLKNIRKRGIIVSLINNNVNWSYFDEKESKTYEVRGVFLNHDERIAVKYSTFPPSVTKSWELVLIE